MSYSENHNSMRTSILDHDNAQYYQTSKKSNMSKRPPKIILDNNSAALHNSCQKTEVQSRLNYNCAPFTPKQQPQNSNESKHILSDGRLDSANASGRMLSEQDNNYYQQGPNVSYDAFSGNITNQCMYNPLEFMPYLYQFQNPGNTSNYWPMMPNNSYYGHLGLSTNIEPNQNMFMMGKGSENSFSTNNNFNSTNIQTNSAQLIQNNRQNSQVIKPTNSSNINPDAPAPGILWNEKLLEKNINQLSGLSLSNHEFNSPSINDDSRKYHSFDPVTCNQILNSVSDPKIRKRLSETMLTINPSNLMLKTLTRARFFVIKSYSEDDLHRAIKHGVWCSTKAGNNKLNNAYLELTKYTPPNQEIGRLFLFFSVNGSGFFAGIAEMISPVDFDAHCGFWSQNKWIGRLNIKWHYVKDVRNSSLRHIRSEANENKPVTNSRDAVEVTPLENGIEFIKVFHHAKHETSVFDDFEHYEQREMNPSTQ